MLLTFFGCFLTLSLNNSGIPLCSSVYRFIILLALKSTTKALCKKNLHVIKRTNYLMIMNPKINRVLLGKIANRRSLGRVK